MPDPKPKPIIHQVKDFNPKPISKQLVNWGTQTQSG